MSSRVPQMSQQMCRCKHSPRSHGPRLGEQFHRQCWLCQCQEFECQEFGRAEEMTMPVIGTAEVAEQLQVSRGWVRDHAMQLGGTKDARGHWRFLSPEAVNWGKEVIAASRMSRTVIFRCPDCNDESVNERGGLGFEVVDQPHLPGQCRREAA